QLPVPSTIIAKGTDPSGNVNLHRLTDPRPFVSLVYKTWIEPDDGAARGILSDPSYDARGKVMLPAKPESIFPGFTIDPAGTGSATVTPFAPESVTVQATSTSPGILRVALVLAPGWEAAIDGKATSIELADTAVMAVIVPAGDHTVQFTYRPASYTLGL